MKRIVPILAVLVAIAYATPALAGTTNKAPTVKQALHALAKERPFLEDVVCHRAGKTVRCSAQIEIEANATDNTTGEKTKCRTPQTIRYAFSVQFVSHRLVIKQLPEPTTKVECPMENVHDGQVAAEDDADFVY